MSDETLQIIAAAAVTLAQVYIVEPWKFHAALARIWDWIARVAGNLANSLAWLSMNARANYYTAVHADGEL